MTIFFMYYCMILLSPTITTEKTIHKPVRVTSYPMWAIKCAKTSTFSTLFCFRIFKDPRKTRENHIYVAKNIKITF